MESNELLKSDSGFIFIFFANLMRIYFYLVFYNKQERRIMNDYTSIKWTNRFIVAAIVQGSIIIGLTLFFVFSQISFLKPEISRVIAAGGAGIWLTFGYILYIVVGVLGVAVSALFYYYLEKVLGKPYDKFLNKILAWIHLLLMNIGATVTMSMLMYAGYIGGASMLPKNSGGLGFNYGQAHQILVPFVDPIGVGITVLSIGVILGGIGFILTFIRKDTIEKHD